MTSHRYRTLSSNITTTQPPSLTYIILADGDDGINKTINKAINEGINKDIKKINIISLKAFIPEGENDLSKKNTADEPMMWPP